LKWFSGSRRLGFEGSSRITAFQLVDFENDQYQCSAQDYKPDENGAFASITVVNLDGRRLVKVKVKVGVSPLVCS
jgi:hypothetical protein